ncbi:hypothetical protein ACLOJK_034862 [Asimina triloba]
MPASAIELDQRPNPATIQPSIPFAPSKIQHLPPDPADGEYNSHARTAVGHHSDHQFSSVRKTESASIQTEIRQMWQRTHPNGHSSSKIIQPNTETALEGHDKGNEMHYGDFGKQKSDQNEDSSEQMLEKDVADETKAPTEAKFNKAEKVEQELPKSCIPVMSSTPPSINIDEEEAPQVELKIIPHSIRVASLPLLKPFDPGGKGDTVWLKT